MSEDFDTLVFEKRLLSLKDTQESIQALSSWCMTKREHHKKIVASWLNVLKRAKVEQRLILFYLANDVIQYSKRKNYDFVESWGTTLQKATPLVRDDKVKQKILRIFRIWEERQIYDDEFLTDLTGLLSVTAGKQAPDLDPNDFQVGHLVNKIRQCSVLETGSNQGLKQIDEITLPLKNVENLAAMLKERRDTEEAKQELDNGIVKLEGYVSALQKELVARTALCRLLQKAHQHYATQRGEVKVVVNAYKNFGSRVRQLKRKLDDLYEHLPSMPISPVPSPPSPGEAVPSPGPDEDLDLPYSGSLDTSNTSINDNSQMNDEDFSITGFGSFLGSNEFPFSSFRNNFSSSNSDEAKKIEVINTRPSSAVPEKSSNINSLLNSLISTKSPALAKIDTTYRPRLTPPPPPPILPGLDLVNLMAETDNKNSKTCPPKTTIHFYGSNSTNQSIAPSQDAPESYNNRQGSQWNNSWEMQSHLVVDTPESPPIEKIRSPPPPPIIPVPPPAPDVDHRQLLAPPPAMPQVLMKGDDIDHRMLPPLPPAISPQPKRQNHKDVDHRNLISLTMGSLPPPPAPPISPWTPQSVQVDKDYRCRNEEFSSLVPPPLPPNMNQLLNLNQPPPQRRPLSHNDNVESIDMEMSDEEMHDSVDDDYNRHMRIESSMARIHGHPPPSMHQPMYRKHEPNRDKSFNNNRPSYNAPPTSDNMQHPDNTSRGNLVSINSDKDMRNMADENPYLNESNDSDIFADFPSNAMNPSNPNVHKRLEDDWERSDEETNHDPWLNRKSLINPTTSSFARTRLPMFNQRQPPINFRRPPPLLGIPTFMDESHFNSLNVRGKGSFRRPWGNQRPPRGAYW